MLQKTKSLLSKGKTTLLFMIIFLGTLGLLIYLYQVFTIQNIQLLGDSDTKSVSEYYGKFLLTLHEDEVEEKLYRQNADITDIKVEKEYPDSLIITVDTSEPIAYIKINDAYMLLSESGRVIEKTKEITNDVDIVEIKYYQQFYYDQYVIGDIVDRSDILAALEFLADLQEIKADTDSIDITSPHMIVLSGTEKRYIVTIEKQITLQFEQLKIINERLRGQGQQYSQVDLRFEKPIITF